VVVPLSHKSYPVLILLQLYCNWYSYSDPVTIIFNFLYVITFWFLWR
jgi:hypothetical protein